MSKYLKSGLSHYLKAQRVKSAALPTCARPASRSEAASSAINAVGYTAQDEQQFAALSTALVQTTRNSTSTQRVTSRQCSSYQTPYTQHDAELFDTLLAGQLNSAELPATAKIDTTSSSAIRIMEFPD